MTASDEAKKALEGVTPGPWFTSPDGWRVTDKIVSFDEDGARHGETPNICIFAESEANARFIAWCREGVPALLAEIAALRAKLVAAVSIADSALNAVAEVQNYKQPDDPWTENALTMQELDIFDFDVSTARAALASMKGGA